MMNKKIIFNGNGSNLSQFQNNKPGMSFEEFVKKSWTLPDDYYGNRYSCMVHGIGLCDEWPQIKYPTDGGRKVEFFKKI